MNRIKTSYAFLVLLLCMNTGPSMADPFQQGNQQVTVIAGSGSAYGDNYIVLGAGYAYYLIRGLALGIDAQFWLNGDPSITKLSPQIKYVFTQPKTLKPYVGAFYSRTYTDGLEDLDSIGYRAGLYFMGGGNFYFGAGVAYEDYQDCNETVYTSCSETYPEILFSFSM